MLFVRIVLAAFVAVIIFGPFTQMMFESRSVDAKVWEHIRNTQLPDAALETSFFIFLALFSSLVFGLTAGALAFFNSKIKTMFDFSMSALIAMPTYVFGFAYLSFLDFSGPAQSFLKSYAGPEYFFEPRNIYIAGILFGIVTSPYIYFSIRSTFNYNLIPLYESARLLGHSKKNAYIKTVLPIIFPWILTGGLLVVLECLSDFGFVDLFGVNTLSRNLFKSWSSFFSFGSASRLGLIILIICILMTTLLTFIENKIKKSGLDVLNKRNLRVSEKSEGMLQYIFLIFFIGISILLPVIVLVHNSTQIKNFDVTAFALAAGHTLLVSFFTSAFITVIVSSFFISFRNILSNQVFNILSLGYGIPGTLLAVCFYIFFVGNLNINLIQNYFLTPLFLLSFIFMSKFGGVLLKNLKTAQNLLNSDLIQVASTQVPPRLIWKKVEWSQYKPAISLGFVLIFLETAKELPATLLIKPTSSPTLAVRVHQYASESDWALGSGYALTLLFVISLALTLKLLFSKFSKGNSI